MPIYDYQCVQEGCDFKCEEIRTFNKADEDPPLCPSCDKACKRIKFYSRVAAVWNTSIDTVKKNGGN